jgi:hypothetical protein
MLAIGIMILKLSEVGRKEQLVPTSSNWHMIIVHDFTNSLRSISSLQEFLSMTSIPEE